LIEQGKISLNDSIQKFIAGFPVKGHRITIENLLTQTSGIPDYLDLEYSSPNAFRIDFTPGQVIDSLKKQSLEFAPSSKFAYSNSNYFLLGYIIEAVSGLPYPEYLRQHIFKPFLLTNTYYDRPTDIIPNRVNGYERSGDKYRNADFISMAAFYSAGAIISNTADLLKWNEALMHGSIIKKQTLAQAFRPFTLAGGGSSEYGYGWFIRTLEGSKTIEHGGSVFGFRSEEIFLPAENIYIAGLFNCRQLNNDEQELCYDIARLMLGKSLVKEFSVSEETLHQYIGVYKNDQYNLTMTIHSGPGDKIYCDLSNGTGTNMIMSAQSNTLFVLPQIKRIHTTLQFVAENGAVVKIICSQETPVEFKRVE
jgi:CubicO group peptidase (beta-lactamase class C family)